MSGLREIGQGAARVLLSVPEASFSFSAQQVLPCSSACGSVWSPQLVVNGGGSTRSC